MSTNNFKNIHIGEFIKRRIIELKLDMNRICNFMQCTENEIVKMYEMESLDGTVLLKWSKLLEYDFFRIYSQHLILFAPPASLNYSIENKKSELPRFRKNIYTKQIIQFMLELITTGKKTTQQIILEYKIPKNTLYNWIKKYPLEIENKNGNKTNI